jgi:hypothetical protein
MKRSTSLLKRKEMHEACHILVTHVSDIDKLLDASSAPSGILFVQDRVSDPIRDLNNVSNKEGTWVTTQHTRLLVWMTAAMLSLCSAFCSRAR